MYEFERHRDNRIKFNTKDELIEALKGYDPNIKTTDPGHISKWDVSQITDMSELFSGIEEFNEDISNWDVSNVTNMERMFEGCTSFNQPLDTWNVSNVENMEEMFKDCSIFNQPLNSWNVSNVTTMESMFSGCIGFNQPLNNWNVSNVKNMSYMFIGCSKFNQPLNNWGLKLGNVTDMSSMFSGCSVFNQPLNMWNVISVINMPYMFSDCSVFNQPLTNWDVSNVTNMSSMFSYCSVFNQPLTIWDVSNVTNMSSMFYGCSVFNQPLTNWNVSSVINMSYMFYGCSVFNQPLDSWGHYLGSVINMSYMFYECSDFNQPLNNWNVSSVINMSYMFYKCSSFNQPLDSWGPNIGNVNTMEYMFAGCTKFNQNLSSWNLRQHVRMSSMFTLSSMTEKHLPHRLDPPVQRNQDISNIKENIKVFGPNIEILEKYFNPTVYTIKYSNLYNNPYRFQYNIFYKTKNDSVGTSSECISFFINHKNKIIKFNRLKYSAPNVCKVNGAELLFLLFKFATEIGYNIQNTQDVSSKIFYEGSIHCIIESLSIYNILLNGETYYNKFGYGYGNNKVKSYEHLRSMTIKKYFAKLKTTYVEEIIEFFNTEDPSANITNATVIKDFMAVIDRVIKKYEPMSESEKKKEILCKIAKYVNYIIENSPEEIDYNADDLLLDINDPTTIELYKNLEKKIKLTTEVTGGKKTKRKKSRKVKRNTRQKRQEL